MATKTQSDKAEGAVQEQPEVEVLEPEEISPSELELLADDKMDKASSIVWRKMLYSGGVGLIPLPLVDLAAFLAFQIHMTKQLADVFDVPYSDNWGKSVVSSLVGSVLPVGLAGSLAYGLKQVPVVGTTTSALSLSVLAAACTYALGKVFTSHFASGGSFLTMNAETLKQEFKERFKEGRQVVAGMAAEARA